MKQLILTISPQMWEEYKAAASKRQGRELDEKHAERLAQMDMWIGMHNTIYGTNLSGYNLHGDKEKEGKNE